MPTRRSNTSNTKCNGVGGGSGVVAHTAQDEEQALYEIARRKFRSRRKKEGARVQKREDLLALKSYK